VPGYSAAALQMALSADPLQRRHVIAENECARHRMPIEKIDTCRGRPALHAKRSLIPSFLHRSAPMTIRHRLVRLEKTARIFEPIVEASERPLTDEEEADLTGEHLWLTPDWELHSRLLAQNPLTVDKAPAYRAWHPTPLTFLFA
jgi:hypothetical protein